MTGMQQRLFALRDEPYAAFQSRLLPTVPPETVIGVRTPDLRRLARELHGTPEAAAFLDTLPHTYFDENQLHVFLLGRLADFDACLQAVETFLPFVNNWATCDQLSPAVFRRHPERLRGPIDRWLCSSSVYTVRFGVVCLMRYFLDDGFSPDDMARIQRVDTDDYYLHMAVAWYMATALAKQYQTALPVLEQRRLAPRTHNKAIQKAVESYRLTADQKAYLKTLKIR